MGLSLPTEIRNQSSRCPFGFSCVDDNRTIRCRVLDANGENVLFIENSRPECPYNISFGSSRICRCPTRYYLFTHWTI